MKPHNPYLFRRNDLRNPGHRPKLVDVRQLIALVDYLEDAVKRLAKDNDQLAAALDEMESRAIRAEERAA